MNINGDILANMMIFCVSPLKPRSSDATTPPVVLSFFSSARPNMSFFVVRF